ncbi:MAG: hypothetical protein KBG28_02840 [Kofleriaceae bacterium]|jgi:hypothetical protein|nr:hypothetical protein [Kofleriaceae bacterium]MBP6839160.1 hypothetical protein [Kofleriaceae bacterium]MBP9202895.1 hypothetical protein [Kofleriaceae bacterium]
MLRLVLSWSLPPLLLLGACQQGSPPAPAASAASAPGRVAAAAGAPTPTPAGAAAAPPTASAAAAPVAVPPGGDGYAGDVDRICNVLEYSGALTNPEVSPIFATAQWLGQALQTEQGRQFLARVQPLTGAAKADALDDEARRVGLTSCPLADAWRR